MRMGNPHPVVRLLTNLIQPFLVDLAGIVNVKNGPDHTAVRAHRVEQVAKVKTHIDRSTQYLSYLGCIRPQFQLIHYFLQAPIILMLLIMLSGIHQRFRTGTAQ